MDTSGYREAPDGPSPMERPQTVIIIRAKSSAISKPKGVQVD